MLFIFYTMNVLVENAQCHSTLYKQNVPREPGSRDFTFFLVCIPPALSCACFMAFKSLSNPT